MPVLPAMSQPGGRQKLMNELVGEEGQASAGALEMLTCVSGPGGSGQLQVDVDGPARKRREGLHGCCMPQLCLSLSSWHREGPLPAAQSLSGVSVRDLCPSVCQNWLVRRRGCVSFVVEGN